MYTRRLEITTTVGCVNACRVCPQGLLKRAYAERSDCRVLTPETFRQCLRTVPPGVLIEFCGMSEPFGNPDCADMVLQAHASGYAVSMYTTAVGMGEADVEKIRSVPFVTFSLHLPDIDGNFRLRVTGAYLAVLSRLRDAGIASLESMSLGRADEKARRALDGIPHHPQDVTRLKSRAGTVSGRPVLHKSGRILCLRSPRLTRWVLLPNGDVCLCCMDYGLKHVIGNLTRQGYHSIAVSADMEQIRRRLKDDRAGDVICRRCEIAGRPVSHLRNVYSRFMAKVRLLPRDTKVPG